MRRRLWALRFPSVLAPFLMALGKPPSGRAKPNARAKTGGKKAQKANRIEPVGETEGDLGESHVKVKSAALTKDYEGAPSIFINYAWTNNSRETTCAVLSIVERAFQDGIELESAIITNEANYHVESSFKGVRPGITLDAQCAFVLRSKTSLVEFEMSEVSESFNLSLDKLHMVFDLEGLS